MRINRMQETGPLGKLLTATIGAALLVVGFMFSLVLLAVAVAGGLGVWAWFWWKTRRLRELHSECLCENASQASHSPSGDIIEGEAVIIEEEKTLR